MREEDLAQPLAYRDFAGRPHRKNLGGLALHLFLHQIHHRGQVTTLLSQAGIDFGDTDLPELLPEEGPALGRGAATAEGDFGLA